jgi:hypothetical protein
MKVSTHINRGVRRMAVLSVAFFAGAVPAQAATNAHVYRLLHTQPESVPLVTDNSTFATSGVRVFRLHSRAESVPLVTDNSGKTAGTTTGQDYGQLDPIIADAIRGSSQLDPIIADAVRESEHPTATPMKLTSNPSSSTGFNWRDSGIGAAAVLAVVALGAGVLVTFRRRGGLAQPQN